MGNEAEGFERFTDALNGERVVTRMIGTALVDVEEAVGGLRARTNAVEISALSNQSI